MADGNKTDKEDRDWNFSNSRLVINPQASKSSALEDSDNTEKTEKVEKTEKTSTLILHKTAVPTHKTRSAMANDLQKNMPKEEGDVYEVAPLLGRAIAFMIDLFFVLGLWHLLKSVASIWPKLIHFILNRYKLVLILPESFVVKMMIVFSFVSALVVFVILPMVFYNCSVGKKILGLRVRGETQYSLSTTQAFTRELIAKPIGVILIASFIIPFFSKKNLSLHDLMAHTLVIKN